MKFIGMFQNSMVFRLWNYLTRAHLDRLYGIRERKTYVLTNRILVICIAFLLFVLATLPMQAGSNLSLMQVLPQVVLLVWFSLALVVNHYSFHITSKYMFLFGGNIFIWLFSAYYKVRVGSEVFYFVFYFLPLILFTNRQKIYIFMAMGFSVILYLSLSISPGLWVDFPAISYPDEMAHTAKLANSFLAFVITGFIVYSFFHSTSEAEESLEKEKKHSEELLLNILPSSIAERIKSGEKIIVDYFDSATVIFADLQGFTKFASSVEPTYLIKELNRIFSGFDDLTEKYGVEKIKTMGDCYMAVSGVPLRSTPVDHARNAIMMAIEMQEQMQQWKAEVQGDLDLRIGIHTGPINAGIIGKKKFVYDLWGDTVNIASRLESNGVIGRIQVSKETQHLLKSTFSFEKRGKIELKGKGKTEVYLLLKMHDA